MGLKKNKIAILDGLKNFPLGETLKNHFSLYSDVKLFNLYCEKDRFLFNLYNKVNTIEKIITNNNDRISRLDEREFFIRIKNYSPDFIFVIYSIAKFINPFSLKNYCKLNNIRLILYDTDGLNVFANKGSEFNNFLKKELIVYDKIISFSKFFTDYLINSHNIDAVYIPYGGEVGSKFTANKKFKHDVVFVGAADLRRIFYLEAISNKVEIFGNRWKKYKDHMTDELYKNIKHNFYYADNLFKILDSSKIILNITKSNYSMLGGGANLRIFEAMGRGLFVLTDKNNETNEMFSAGKDLDFFDCPIEMRDKINFYLTNNKIRNTIAKTGFYKIRKTMSWAITSKKIIKEISS